jgi:hypothetical protein
MRLQLCISHLDQALQDASDVGKLGVGQEGADFDEGERDRGDVGGG